MRKQNAARGRASRSSAYRALCVILSVLVPPLGWAMTMRSRWSANVKVCMTGLAAVSLAAMVMLFPDPDARVSGSVELVGRQKDAEIYGPELPTAMVTHMAPLTGSVIADPTGEPKEETTYVYAMPGAKYYHLKDCRYAYESAQKLTLYEAHFMGYDVCPDCKPPVYTPGTLP